MYSPELSEGKMSNFVLDKYNEWLDHKKVKSTLKREVIENEYTWETQVSKIIPS